MNQYPTDEELNQFMEKLEMEEMYAPSHLKEEILLKASKMNQNAQEKRRKNEPVLFLAYTLKIVGGMVAAILLVFMVPAQNGSSVRVDIIQKESGENIRSKVSLDEKISSFFEEQRENAKEWNQKISNNLNLESLGGYDNED